MVLYAVCCSCCLKESVLGCLQDGHCHEEADMEEEEAMEEGAALALSTCLLLLLLLKMRDERPSFLTMAGFNLISRSN